jgi:hypothetical protein
MRREKRGHPMTIRSTASITTKVRAVQFDENQTVLKHSLSLFFPGKLFQTEIRSEILAAGE